MSNIVNIYPRDMAGYGAKPPKAKWPDGARIAVQFVLNYEEGAENTVLNGDAGSELYLHEVPGGSPVLGERNRSVESQFDYGARAGAWRVLRLFAERGLKAAGIQLIGPGDVVDDDVLADMGDVALGTITSHHYSAAHPSAMNKKFVEGIAKANNGMRPSFMAVGGYDGMHVIMEGLKSTKGAGGEALVNAMKGMVFESPRGPMFIDAQTRDVVQNIYLRKVQKQDGQLYNVEFDTIKDVKDPGKNK